jgi:hypothetical protein
MSTHSIGPAVVGLFLIMAGGLGGAQESGGPSPKKKEVLPEGLNHVPVDALAFVHVRVGRLLNSEPGRLLLAEFHKDKQAAKVLDQMEKKAGLALADVESVTVFFPAWPAPRPDEGGPFGVPGMWDFKVRPESKVPVPSKGVPKPSFPDSNPKDFDFKFEEKRTEPLKEALDESPVAFQDFAPPPLPPFMQADAGFAGSSPLVIVTAAKAINRKALLSSWLSGQGHPGDADAAGPLGHEVTAIFLSDRSVLVGPSLLVLRHVDRVMTPTKDDKSIPRPPLAEVLNQTVGDHHIIAGGHVPAAVRNALVIESGPERLRAQLATLYPLLSVIAARVTVDLDKTADVRLSLQAANERAAALAAQSVKSSLASFDLILEAAQGIRQAQGEPGGKRASGRDVTLFLRQALSRVVVEEAGAKVECRLQMDIAPGLFQQVAGEVVAALRQGGDRARSVNNLKQIALAMHSYHDVFRGFPPAGLTGVKNRAGKPLLSWRVAILPFLEQEALYRHFDLDLPWDHPVNKKLIDKMPSIFALPGAEAPRGQTYYQVFVGPDTPFERRPAAGQANLRMSDITDGTSNTLMVVEAANPVIWTKPDDLPFGPNVPLPKLGGHFDDGFNAAFCDGAVRFLRRLDEKTLRALITRNGGEIVNLGE